MSRPHGFGRLFSDPPYLTPSMTTDLMDVLGEVGKTAMVLCPTPIASRRAAVNLAEALGDANRPHKTYLSSPLERVTVPKIGASVLFRSTYHSGHRGESVDLVAIRTLEHDVDPTTDEDFNTDLIATLRPHAQIKRYTA